MLAHRLPILLSWVVCGVIVGSLGVYYDTMKENSIAPKDGMHRFHIYRMYINNISPIYQIYITPILIV